MAVNFDYLFNDIRGNLFVKLGLSFVMVYVDNLNVTLEVILNYLL